MLLSIDCISLFSLHLGLLLIWLEIFPGLARIKAVFGSLIFGRFNQRGKKESVWKIQTYMSSSLQYLLIFS